MSSTAEKSHTENQKEISYRALTKLLSYALIEIRASQDLETAQKIADIFHNLPSALAVGVKSASELMADVEARATRLGMENYVRALAKTAKTYA